MMLLLIDGHSCSQHERHERHVTRLERKRGETVWVIGSVVFSVAALRQPDVDFVVDFREVVALIPGKQQKVERFNQRSRFCKESRKERRLSRRGGWAGWWHGSTRSIYVHHQQKQKNDKKTKLKKNCESGKKSFQSSLLPFLTADNFH